MDLKNSMLLANMMSRKGGGSGTLNAEIVGTPTISDDWILSNFDNSNYLKFNPANPNNDVFEIRAKFRIADLTKKGCIFMCSPDQKGIKLTYGGDGAGQNGLSFLVTDGSGASWGNAAECIYRSKSMDVD